MHRTEIVGLTAIAAAYLALVIGQSSTSWFGYYHDDSLYWTAAQSLASGDGYRMASVPGEPAQTKYPVLFPWALSWVWRLAPEFPANLHLALGLVALCGVAFLGGCLVLLRQLGLGGTPALILTAVCAVHPIVVHLSGLLLSDVPFAALVAWSLVCCHVALARQGEAGGGKYWAASLGLAALATLVRSLGVTLFAGVALAALWRRSYRPAAVSLVLAIALGLGPALAAAGVSTEAAAQSGYEQTLQFYASYAAFWKLSTPDWPTLEALLSFNFRELLKQPAVGAFRLPAAGFAGFGWQLAAVALSFLVVKGLAGLTAAARHPALPFLGVYTVLVLAWNYTLMDRFYLWALPLFVAGAWTEISRLAQTTRELWRRRAPLLDRAVAAAVMAALAAVVVYGGYRYVWVAPQARQARLAERAELQAQKRQAYEWILKNTSPSDRFIASEDASLYLYTGRQALRPMAFSTAAFYLQSQEALGRDLERMTDAACRIGARYWLSSADDYHLESAQEFIQQHTAGVLQGRPEVFVSDSGKVRIYDITSITAGDSREGADAPANPSRG